MLALDLELAFAAYAKSGEKLDSPPEIP